MGYMGHLRDYSNNILLLSGRL